MPITSTQKRAMAWTALAVLAVLALRALGPVLTPFMIGAVLAYVLAPLVDRLEGGRGRLARLAAVVVVELLFVFAVLCLLLLIVPVLVKELPLMREQVPVLFDRLDTSLSPWLAQYGLRVALDLTSLREKLAQYLQASGSFGSLWSSLKIGGSLALTVVGNAVLVPVALFYLLLDWKRLVVRVLELEAIMPDGTAVAYAAEADGHGPLELSLAPLAERIADGALDLYLALPVAGTMRRDAQVRRFRSARGTARSRPHWASSGRGPGCWPGSPPRARAGCRFGCGGRSTRSPPRRSS